MHSLTPHHGSRGFTFVEMLITAAVVALVFGGLLMIIQTSLKMVNVTKGTVAAVTLADDRLEYIRSLSYAAVGTVGGIPSGNIPQTSTTSLNGTLYHERVLIQYVDSPDDGTGASDENGILADYKEVKVEYTWLNSQGTTSIFVLTNIVPPGIESVDGGGTLTVNVFDASVQPIQGAEVHIYNDTTTTTIDTSRFTNDDGRVMFAGAPAAANYRITVTKDGYSTDQTHSASVSNPNPTTPHVAVIESSVSTMNFQIDLLSGLLVRTVGPATTDEFLDEFTDNSNIETSSSIEVVSGEARLFGGPGAYTSSGNMQLASVTPSSMDAWEIASWDAVVPANTSLTVQVYSVSGSSYTLIPEGDLPGNSVGFTSGPINLTGLDAGTYPTLALGATLTSSDPNTSPRISEWSISHVISEPTIGGIPFTLTSSKIIGATPVYKYEESHVTNGSGEIQLGDMEWDSYTFDLDTTSYDIAIACPDIPYILDPGVSETLTLTLVPAAAYTMRTNIVDADGNPIVNASVTLSRSGFSSTEETGSCGQVFFNSGLSNNSDYEIDVDATGYVSQTISGIGIDGDEALKVTLIQI